MSGREISLLTDFSLEITGKDIDRLTAAAAHIPRGTRVHLTYLDSEDLETRVKAAGVCRALELIPVPHVAARRLRSPDELEEFLAGLADVSAADRLFVVGGDPAVPLGPYPDALSVLKSAVPQRFGMAEAGIAGYPEGHPDIPADVLWRALQDKAALLTETGLAGSVVTQFGFDSDAVLDWVEQVRSRGITLPIRVGVPGPAGIRRLVRYATRFGVGTSAGIVRKYGFSITNLMGTAGPDRFLRDLARRWEPQRHGDLRIHFYSFGGVEATVEWIADFTACLGEEAMS
ncbi:methylenetetrahydrofolate reductase [Nocardia jiangxiensis]|uniref:methylenetetrahydrofolate reductase n=1 Tax=Nocardia jiangxiensis TaxID=282685 RepID=UPI00059360D8|nr:methylenetetrahydrofolate reductase [Nocardia jiangxiensis]